MRRHYFFNPSPCAYANSVFADAEIDKILQSVGPLEDATIYNGASDISANDRNSKIDWIPAGSDTDWIYNRISEAVFNLNNSYFQFDIDSIESIQYTEYDVSYNGKFDTHVDDGPEPSRKLSFTLQLSDPSEYEGCEVELFRFSTEGITLPKQKGTISVFPSFALHRVNPITRGNRKCLVGWVHGPRWK